MTIEFLLALLGNLKCLTMVFTVVAGVVILISCMVCGAAMIECDGDERDLWLERMKWALRKVWIVALLAAISCTPDIDDLWKVRLGLLKLQLASSENVSRGSEAVVRIAGELECKYLQSNCPEEKKDSK